MPCNCFGKKKDSKKISSDVPYGKGYIKPVDEGDFVSSKNKPSYLSTDICPKRESYLNDSSVSKSNTPSTAPALGSRNSLSTSPSASPGSYRGALLRSELVEKRKEFFRDYFVVEENKGESSYSATLPALIRPKSFGDARPLRPISQPNSLSSSPLPPPPPGPHLLRPISPQSKIKAETFASPVFLNELRAASDEISRRWQMSDEERDTTRCSLKGNVKVFPVTYIDRQYSSATPSAPPHSDFPDINTYNVEFPELNFNGSYPELDYGIPGQQINIDTESPQIDIMAPLQIINVDSTYPDVNLGTESRNISINEEFGVGTLVTQSTILPFDQPTATIGNGTSSDSGLNISSGGDHQPPFPIIDATPQTDEHHPFTAQTVNHEDDAVSCLQINTSSNLMEELLQHNLQTDNIPLQQERSRPSDGSERTTEEVNRSFSSDEVPDDIPHQPWQEDEIMPLLEEDELAPSSMLHGTSPNLIDN